MFRKALFFEIIPIILIASISLSNIAYAQPALRNNSLFDNINNKKDKERIISTLSKLSSSPKVLMFLIAFLILQGSLEKVSLASTPSDITIVQNQNERKIDNMVNVFEDTFPGAAIQKELGPKEKLEQAIEYLRELAYSDTITTDNIMDYVDIAKVDNEKEWIKTCKEQQQSEGEGGFWGLGKDGKVKMYISGYDSHIVSYEETVAHEKIHLIHGIIYGYGDTESDYKILQDYLIESEDIKSAGLFFNIGNFLRGGYLDKPMPEAFVGSEFYAWFWGLYTAGLLESTQEYQAGSYIRNTLVNLMRNFYQGLDEDAKIEVIRHYVNIGLLKKDIRERTIKSLNEKIDIAIKDFFSGNYTEFIREVPYVSKWSPGFYEVALQLNAMKLAARIMVGEIAITKDNVKDFCEKYKKDPFIGPYITGETNWNYSLVAKKFEQWPGFKEMMSLIEKERASQSPELNEQLPDTQLLNNITPRQIREDI